MTIDRGKKNREIRELLARHPNLSYLLVDKRLAPLEFLYAFVRRHKAMEAEIERCMRQGGCFRARVKREGGFERL